MLVSAMKIVSIGEILWDVFPKAEHLGGAAFNFAAHARRLGHEVQFVSGVGDDERGRRALARAEELGMSTRFLRVIPGASTGVVSVEVDPDGQPAFTIHRPAAYDYADFDREDLDQLLFPRADWIAYGTLYQMSEQGHSLTHRILRTAFGSSFFYDINLRPASYTPAIVRQSIEAADMVKLNDDEVTAVEAMVGRRHNSIEDFARDLAGQYDLNGVAVTMGARGCALLLHGEYVEAPGYPVQVADTVGAGDAFSAALLHGVGAGWPAAEIVDLANRVGALIASRPGAVPDWTVAEALALGGTAFRL